MTVYVTMTDSFMSGWGRAKGRTNKLVFICDNMEEAEIVEANAKARGDQKRVNIRSTTPYYDETRIYAQFKTKETYPTWYRPNAGWA